MADRSKVGAWLVAFYLMSLLLFSLAAVPVCFACEVSRVSTQIPGILTRVDHTNGKVGPGINEVGIIRELVPEIFK